jgi:cyclopropane fatty-acyl-phospholipid synthase-like methyltransferase
MSAFKITYEDVLKCPACKKDKSFFNFFDQVEDTLAKELNLYLPSEKFPPIVNTRVQCASCDLIFMSPRLSDTSLTLVYHHWYQYAYNDIFNSEALINERKKEFENYHLKTINLYAKNKGNLLDVGCGSGIFMDLARSKGWSTYGIELDPLTAETGKKQYNIPIFSGRLADIVLEQKMDVVTLFDYLEHTKTPQEDLFLIRDLLNNEGLVFIRVPNQKSLQSQYMQEKWVGYISNHLHYFDNKTLINLVDSCGFKIRAFSCKNYCSQYDLIRTNFNYFLRKISHTKDKKLTSKIVTNPSSLSGERKFFLGKKTQKLVNYFNSVFLQELDFFGGLLNKGNNLMLIAEKK